MARRKPPDDPGASSEWLNTYADMVTLLLTFFILLFSMSTVDASKFNALVRAFAGNSDHTTQIVIFSEGAMESDKMNANHLNDGETMVEIEDLDQVFRMLSQYIQDNGYSETVEIAQGDGDLLIRFMDNMLFEPNSASLKPADLEILNFVGNGIRSIQDQVELIRIDGHTAAVPEIEDYPVSDRILSSDRANAVLTHFENVLGIDPAKMVQMGFGKHVPISDNTDPVDRGRNRRVEIYISSQNIVKDELNNIYEKLHE